jgi:flagellar motor protein MotB
VTYLVNVRGVDRGRLLDKGFGESRLADPASPESAVNRRVQIVNLVTAASN